MIDKNKIPLALAVSEFLAIPSEDLPRAYTVDDDRGEYDHSDAWDALRGAAKGDMLILREMRGVRVAAEVDGWRDGVIVAG